MTTIVSSTYIAGHPQQDGRRYIKDRHLLDDGRSVDFEYLADEQINPDTATIAAVQMYEGLGLIASGRASEVLNG